MLILIDLVTTTTTTATSITTLKSINGSTRQPDDDDDDKQSNYELKHLLSIPIGPLVVAFYYERQTLGGSINLLIIINVERSQRTKLNKRFLLMKL